MKLNIENFAKIKNANIVIDGITVIAVKIILEKVQWGKYCSLYLMPYQI